MQKYFDNNYNSRYYLGNKIDLEKDRTVHVTKAEELVSNFL